MKNDLLISIVTYNENPERLKKTLDAINAPNLKISVTVVDNASKNQKEIEKIAKKHNCAFVASLENKGFGHGHNLAFNSSPQASFFLALNPDITLKEATLTQAVEILKNNPKLGLIVPKVLNPDGTFQKLNKRNPKVIPLLARRFFSNSLQRLPFFYKKITNYQMDDLSPDQETSLEFASGCCMFFNSEIFRKIGGFDERYFLYFEDADITRKINQISINRYIPTLEVFHEWRRGGHHSKKLTFIMILSAFKYFKKWGVEF